MPANVWFRRYLAVRARSSEGPESTDTVEKLPGRAKHAILVYTPFDDDNWIKWRRYGLQYCVPASIEVEDPSISIVSTRSRPSGSRLEFVSRSEADVPLTPAGESSSLIVSKGRSLRNKAGGRRWKSNRRRRDDLPLAPVTTGADEQHHEGGTDQQSPR